MKKRLFAFALTLALLGSMLVLPAGAAGEAAYRYIVQGMIDETQEAYALYGYFPGESSEGGEGALYDLNGDGIQELIALYWRPDEIMEGHCALYARLFTLSPGSDIPALLVNDRLCGNAGASDGFTGVVKKNGGLYFCTFSAEGDDEYYVENYKLYALNGSSASLVEHVVAEYVGDASFSCALNGNAISEQEYTAWKASLEEVLVLQGYGNSGTPLSALLSQVEAIPDSAPSPSVPDSATSTSGMGNFSALYSYYDGLFWDVTADDWFAENVAQAYELGLMNGTGGGSFDPHSDVTLAQSVTLAARLHSIYRTGSDNFDPIPGSAWFMPYLVYAGENGIPCAFNDLDLPATREQFVYILSAALPTEALPAIPSNQWAMDFLDYSDCAYTDAIDLMTRAGIIQGMHAEYGGFRFNPGATIDRASVAAIVTRMAKPDLRIR